MPLAILPFAIVLALVVSGIAAPPPGKKESAQSPDALAATFRGEWTELELGILFPAAGEVMGVKIRRVSKPFSLHFTIQATRGDKAGAESSIAYEKVTALLQDTVRYYQAACADPKNEGRTPADVRNLLADKRIGACMTLKISGVGIDHSAIAEVRTGLAPFCEWLGSLAAMAPNPGDPGEPPEKVETALRKPWTELTVGVHCSEACSGRAHNIAVTFTKGERSIRAQYSHVRDGERLVEELTEIPEGETSTIASEVLKHYRTAFNEHDMGEESIGETVQRDLATAASIARGEGQPIGGSSIIRMYVAGKTADSTYSFTNFMCSASLMNWIAKYDPSQKDR